MVVEVFLHRDAVVFDAAGRRPAAGVEVDDDLAVVVDDCRILAQPCAVGADFGAVAAIDEDSSIALPFEKAFPRRSGLACVEGQPPRLGVGAQMLDVDVAAAIGADVGEQDGAFVGDALRHPVGGDVLELLVAQAELDLVPVVAGDPHHEEHEDRPR